MKTRDPFPSTVVFCRAKSVGLRLLLLGVGVIAVCGGSNDPLKDTAENAENRQADQDVTLVKKTTESRPPGQEIQPDIEGFHRMVKPFLQQYCIDCHNEDTSEGDVRFDNVDPDIVRGNSPDLWEHAREMFNNGKMPPEDEDQPAPRERLRITEWLDAEFQKAIALKKMSAPQSSIRRMTRYELGYTLEDLIGLNSPYLDDLPAESADDKTGMENFGSNLLVGGPQLNSYFETITFTLREARKRLEKRNYTYMVGIKEIIKDLETYSAEDRVKILAYRDKDDKRRKRVYKVFFGEKAEKSGNGVLVNPTGHAAIEVPNLPSEGQYRLTITARADKDTELNLEVGDFVPETEKHNIRSYLRNRWKLKAGELMTFQVEGELADLPLRTDSRSGKRRDLFIWAKPNGKVPVYFEKLDFEAPVTNYIHQALLGSKDAPLDKTTLRKRLRSFVELAFRRTISDQEFTKYAELFDQNYKKKSPMAGYFQAIGYVLASPEFLYLGLPKDQTENPKQFLLAEKMSYLLWASTPDRELLDLARSGGLSDPAVVRQQIDRMLADKKANRLAEQFTRQWLRFDNLFNVSVNKAVYFKFDDTLREDMRQETVASLREVLLNGAPAIDLIDANYVFANRRLAEFYGLPPAGEDFAKIPLPADSKRGGLLGQASIMMSNSDGMHSHAIMRGVWLAKVILNSPPPPPPKQVQSLDDSVPGFDKLTLNEQLKQHRRLAACASCHLKIDPWGIPFEEFDAIGKWREKVVMKAPKKRKPKKGGGFTGGSFRPVDASAALPTGEEVNGVNELKTYILQKRSRDFSQGFVEKIFAYALWRELDFADRDIVESLTNQFIKDDHRVRPLLEAIILSDDFVQPTGDQS